MPYYKDAQQRAPIPSDIITPELVRRLMKVRWEGVVGFVVRSTAAAKLDDFSSPPRLQVFAKEPGPARDFFFVPMAEGVDGFVSYRNGETVDWSAPTWEQILRVFRPLAGGDLAAAERHIEALRKLVSAPGTAPPEREAKLASLPAPDAKVDELVVLLQALGADVASLEAAAVLRAARDPRGFLAEDDLVDRMSVDECRAFSWRTIFVGRLQKLRVVAVVDSRDSRAEIAAAVGFLSPGTTLDDLAPPAVDDMAFEHAMAARDALRRRGTSMILLGESYDSLAFTLVPNEREAKVVALAASLGLTPYPAASKG